MFCSCVRQSGLHFSPASRDNVKRGQYDQSWTNLRSSWSKRRPWRFRCNSMYSFCGYIRKGGESSVSQVVGSYFRPKRYTMMCQLRHRNAELWNLLFTLCLLLHARYNKSIVKNIRLKQKTDYRFLQGLLFTHRQSTWHTWPGISPAINYHNLALGSSPPG